MAGFHLINLGYELTLHFLYKDFSNVLTNNEGVILTLKILVYKSAQVVILLMIALLLIFWGSHKTFDICCVERVTDYLFS